MNNEIKEINIPENILVALSDLTNGALNYYKATETVKVRHNTILDYITNLQRERNNFKTALDESSEIAGELEEKIETLNNIIDDLKKYVLERLFEYKNCKNKENICYVTYKLLILKLLDKIDKCSGDDSNVS